MTVPRRLVDAALGVLRVYWRLAAPLSVGVRALVLDDGGQVALVRHAYGDMALHLPGGGVKRREAIVAAMRRELQEETNLHVVADGDALALLGTYTNFEEGKSDHVSVFVVASDQWEGTTEPGGLEIDHVLFADPRHLPPDTSPGTRRRLGEYLGDRPVSFTW